MLKISLLFFTFSLIFFSPALLATKELNIGHHLSGINMPEQMTLPKKWPLKNNQLACISCHSDETIAKKTIAEINTKTADFLRGGPYSRLETFCDNCHNTDDYQPANIHQMLDSKGQIIKDNCLFCHSEVPETDSHLRKQKVKLRLNKEKICYGCHLKTPHLNAIEHQGKVGKQMKKHIKTAEQQLKVKLPLATSGQILCITCHSPHQKNVLDPNLPEGKQTGSGDLNKGVQYQKNNWNIIVQRDKRDRLTQAFGKDAPAFIYQQINHQVLLRLSAKNGELCLACHQFTR